jgi:hypothetical protein
VRVRADEGDTRRRERLREGFALGQETVARMHRLGARLAAGFDDLLDDEVGLGCLCGPQMHRLVRHLHMERIPVRIGENRHRLDPHPARGLDDPAGDLAAIGNQDLVEHGPSNAGTPRTEAFAVSR